MKRNRGFTLIEVLAALAIGAIMMIGLSALIDSSLEDTKAQQTAHYQAQVTHAANRYITDRYLHLIGTATDTEPVAVPLSTLKTEGYLSDSFETTNAYRQHPCLLVLRRTTVRPDGSSVDHLDALVVTEGGEDIPPKSIAFVAANAGQGGGFIENGASGLVARGAFGSSTVDGTALANYRSANCSGTAFNAGRLASSLFYDGPGRLSTDFLYRDAVPNRPELNRMTTPLQIRLETDAVENSNTDPLCRDDEDSKGRFVVNRNGVILSCQAGTWKRPPNLHWREPVTTHAALVDLPIAGNEAGDVRMVTDIGRAFTWKENADGSFGWAALGIDESGNLSVPGTVTASAVTANTVSANTVELLQTVTKDSACSPNGSLARAADGMVLSCKSGAWRSLLDTRITGTAKILDVTYTPANGLQNYYILLPAPPGGPLYISGFTHCHSSGGARILIAIEVFDANNNRLGYNGGCGARSDPGGVVLTKGFIALQKIPQNAAAVRVYVEPGSIATDYALLDVSLYSSE